MTVTALTFVASLVERAAAAFYRRTLTVWQVGSTFVWLALGGWAAGIAYHALLRLVSTGRLPLGPLGVTMEDVLDPIPVLLATSTYLATIVPRTAYLLMRRFSGSSSSHAHQRRRAGEISPLPSQATLLDQIARELATSPDSAFVLTLQGKWGSGKSTLGRLLRSRAFRARYRKDHPGSRIPVVVHFDAWSHEGAPSLELALYRAITRDWEVLPRVFHVRPFWTLVLHELAVAIKIRLSVGGLSVDMDSKPAVPWLLWSRALGRAVDELERRGWRLVVFLDEVDRCSPATAQAIYGLVKRFLTQGSTITILPYVRAQVRHKVFNPSSASVSPDLASTMEAVMLNYVDTRTGNPIEVREPLHGDGQGSSTGRIGGLLESMRSARPFDRELLHSLLEEKFFAARTIPLPSLGQNDLAAILRFDSVEAAAEWTGLELWQSRAVRVASAMARHKPTVALARDLWSVRQIESLAIEALRDAELRFPEAALGLGPFAKLLFATMVLDASMRRLAIGSRSEQRVNEATAAGPDTAEVIRRLATDCLRSAAVNVDDTISVPPEIREAMVAAIASSEIAVGWARAAVAQLGAGAVEAGIGLLLDGSPEKIWATIRSYLRSTGADWERTSQIIKADLSPQLDRLEQQGFERALIARDVLLPLLDEINEMHSVAQGRFGAEAAAFVFRAVAPTLSNARALSFAVECGARASLQTQAGAIEAMALYVAPLLWCEQNVQTHPFLTDRATLDVVAKCALGIAQAIQPLRIRGDTTPLLRGCVQLSLVPRLVGHVPDEASNIACVRLAELEAPGLLLPPGEMATALVYTLAAVLQFRARTALCARSVTRAAECVARLPRGPGTDDERDRTLARLAAMGFYWGQNLRLMESREGEHRRATMMCFVRLVATSAGSYALRSNGSLTNALAMTYAHIHTHGLAEATLPLEDASRLQTDARDLLLDMPRDERGTPRLAEAARMLVQATCEGLRPPPGEPGAAALPESLDGLPALDVALWLLGSSDRSIATRANDLLSSVLPDEKWLLPPRDGGEGPGLGAIVASLSRPDLRSRFSNAHGDLSSYIGSQARAGETLRGLATCL